MTEKFFPYDPAEALRDSDAIEVFMTDAFKTRDAAYIAAALAVVKRSKGFEELAAKAGLSGDQLMHSLITAADSESLAAPR